MSTANYSGTVTKPASADTRRYIQKYTGNVTKPGNSGLEKFDAWVPNGGLSYRYGYRIGTTSVDVTYVEGPGTTVQLAMGPFENYNDAIAKKNQIDNSQEGKVRVEDDESNNYYVATPTSSSVNNVLVGTYPSSTYYNKTKTPIDQIMFPIGKGWSWSLPFIESNQGKKYLHMANGGSYEIVGTTLKGYDWEGLTFNPDTTVKINPNTINEETSSYSLSSVSGTWKQHFSSDGRLIRISDAYDNTIEFSYTQNATYGRKLLSQVKDAIGNTIQITYSTTEVIVTKGNQTVIYKKRTDAGMELLESVTDVEGRKTTYEYKLKGAKSNLFNYDPFRAISNSYALIEKVNHPTGAISEIIYEPSPVKRYSSTYGVNEEYRVFSRQDTIVYDNGQSEAFNRQTFDYHDVDYGQSYGQDLMIMTTVNNGTILSTSHYKKDFINDQTPTQIYLEKTETSADNVIKTSTNAYSKKVGARAYPVSVPTSTIMTDNKTPDILTTSITYDDYGNVLQQVDATGATTTYTYDPIKYLLQTVKSQVDTNKHLFTAYSYNPQGDVIETIVRANNAEGEVLQQVKYENRDIHGNVTTRTVMNGDKSSVTTIEYGADSHYAFPTKQSVNVTNVDGTTSVVSTTAIFNPLTGLMSSSVDGNNNETTYVYDDLGRIEQVTYPGQETFSALYNDVLNTVLIKNEIGNKTQIKWNALGWKMEEGAFECAVLLGECNEYKKKAKYGYDSIGRNVWSEDAAGNRTQYAYDNWSRPTITTNPLGDASTISYNDSTRQITQADPEGNRQIQSLNKYGQVLKLEEQPKQIPNQPIVPPVLLSEYVYNPINGKLKQQTDAKTNVTNYNYDLNGQLTSVSNAINETTEYTYDQLGNLVKTTSDGRFKEKFYDELGRLIQTKDEMGQPEDIYYDGNGNVVKRIDRERNTTNYVYDNRNRLITQASQDQTVSYTYDDSGKRLSMGVGTEITTYQYKPYTELLEKLSYPDGLSMTITYDQNGLREKMTGPFGQDTYYGYNTLNQLETVGTIESVVGTNENVADARYTYFRNGLLNNSLSLNGVNSNYEYSGSQLTSLKHRTKWLLIATTINSMRIKTSKREQRNVLRVAALPPTLIASLMMVLIESRPRRITLKPIPMINEVTV
ncbi:hypothetical protein [Paenibacillus sp. IITD108]|uniref:hypothetical protein n=1 Tax=Paenibacillus sp. IITD108 TaxID=3116649 RepID=UPI002F420E06